MINENLVKMSIVTANIYLAIPSVLLQVRIIADVLFPEC